MSREVHEIWNNMGEKWAYYIFDVCINDPELFKQLLATNDVWFKLCCSAYTSMVQMGRIEPIEKELEKDRRDFWEAAKKWCPSSTHYRQVRVAEIIHMLTWIAEQKLIENENKLVVTQQMGSR